MRVKITVFKGPWTKPRREQRREPTHIVISRQQQEPADESRRIHDHHHIIWPIPKIHSYDILKEFAKNAFSPCRRNPRRQTHGRRSVERDRNRKYSVQEIHNKQAPWTIPIFKINSFIFSYSFIIFININYFILLMQGCVAAGVYKVAVYDRQNSRIADYYLKHYGGK